MRTFAPKRLFFHVKDKYLPTFIKKDLSIPMGATYLYEVLFDFCGDKDHCYPSQSTLAILCKTTTRSVQNYVAELTRTDYIAVKKDEKTGRNIYYLLLSARLIALLRKLGIPTHDPQISGAASKGATAQGAHENFSPNIRDQNQNTPLSPLPKPRIVPGRSPARRSRTGFPSSAPTPPERVQGRGDFSTLSRTHATPHATRVPHRPDAHEFEQLWSAWPETATWAMPRNRQLALRAYRRMRHAGQLPPIEKLLGIVEQYKLKDSRWLNGYPPELSNWLRSRQFEKAPLVRPKKTFFGNFFGKPEPAEPVLTPEEQRQAEKIRQQMEALRERYAKSRFTASASTPPSPEIETLITLWPEPERQRLPVQGFLQYLAQSGKKLDLGRLLPEAREYLASTSSPMSLIGWLRGNAACVL